MARIWPSSPSRSSADMRSGDKGVGAEEMLCMRPFAINPDQRTVDAKPINTSDFNRLSGCREIMRIGTKCAPVEKRRPMGKTMADSDLPTKPADSPDDPDFFGRALIGAVERVVGDDAHPRRLRVRDMLQPLGHQTHAVEQHEDAGRCRH